MAAPLSHCRRGRIEVGTDQIAPFLGIELCGDASRAHQIAEHHREVTALAGGFGGWCGSWCCSGGWRGWYRFRAGVSAQRGNGLEQLAAMPDRSDAELPQILRRQARQDCVVDLILAE